MPFASKSQAVDDNGKIKKGFREITDKNGKIKYLSENKPKPIPKNNKEPKGKEPKKKEPKKKESKCKGKNKIDVDSEQFIIEAIES